MTTDACTWPYPGSRWWRFDFHAHTPASHDVDNAVTEKAWLKAAMNAEIDCVVVTDHNSGGWINRLKEECAGLEAGRPDWFRPLVVFPGVEITVGGSADRVHLLAVFDPSKGTETITSVLGACGVHSGFGDEQDTAASTSFHDTVSNTRSAGGIAIPAHADSRNGLLQNARTLNPELEKSLEAVAALEVCDPNAFSGADAAFRRRLEELAWVAGSDAHRPGEIGRHGCWVKMSKPGIDGLRLALMDHPYCLLHQDDDPNHVPDIFLTSLTIKEMRHCGRTPGQPFRMEFHPAFNAVIGGRGTGKSTALESIRVVARRDGELAQFGSLKGRMDSFVSADPKQGVMLNDTELLLGLHRRGKEYLLRWRYDAAGNVLEEVADGGVTVPREAGDVQERFPLSIFSQKQIDALAAEPKGLLDIVDRAPEVGKAEWQRRWDECVSQFLQLRERQRQLNVELGEEGSVKAKLQDVRSDLRQYEEKGHGEILKAYQTRSQQLRSLPVDDDFGGLAQSIRALSETIELADFPGHVFGDDGCAQEARPIHTDTAAALEHVQAQARQLADRVDSIAAQRKRKLLASKWYETVQAAISAYENLVHEYEEKQSRLDPDIYGQWVRNKGELQLRIAQFEGLRSEAERVHEEIIAAYRRLRRLRAELLCLRRDFITQVLGSNAYVQMSLVPFGDDSGLESSYRELLGLVGDVFASSIWDADSGGGILGPCFAARRSGTSDSSLTNRIKCLKKQTEQIATAAKRDVDGRFANRLTNLWQSNPSALDRLWCWWPEDHLIVKYSRDAGNRFDDIERGSAGQRAAAILAFLLSYGDEPLLIDQPEDDLDNALIYDLVVKQIQENKQRRQLVIVSHNPNIVVNGDAELVHVLRFAGGQVTQSHQGGLEEGDIRTAICDIMEGGEDAFTKRYKRIVESR